MQKSMMLRAGCEMGLRVCLKGLLQLNRGVLVFPGRQFFATFLIYSPLVRSSKQHLFRSKSTSLCFFRKILEVFERCKRQGWSCPHIDHMNNADSDQ